MQQQAVVLCEGFDDRAFLAEWLGSLGCRQARKDPWGMPVTEGQFGYTSPSGRFIRVHPCKGRTRIVDLAGVYIDRHGVRSVARLVLCFDADCAAPAMAPRGSVLQSLASRRSVELNDDSGAAIIDGVEVASIVWGCDDAPKCAGVPTQQCLERLVTASIVAAEPDRGASVSQWLRAMPTSVGPEAKAHAYAYLAKWFAASGCEDFYRAVWRDPRVRAQLEQRLRAMGSMQVVEALLRPSVTPGG